MCGEVISCGEVPIQASPIIIHCYNSSNISSTDEGSTNICSFTIPCSYSYPTTSHVSGTRRHDLRFIRLREHLNESLLLNVVQDDR